MSGLVLLLAFLPPAVASTQSSWIQVSDEAMTFLRRNTDCGGAARRSIPSTSLSQKKRTLVASPVSDLSVAPSAALAAATISDKEPGAAVEDTEEPQLRSAHFAGSSEEHNIELQVVESAVVDNVTPVVEREPDKLQRTEEQEHSSHSAEIAVIDEEHGDVDDHHRGPVFADRS